MNRTVSYQETDNNYTDTRQKIKNTQIATIKNFGVAPPSGGGDFVGQFGIAADASGESILYTYGVGGAWQVVGKSGSAHNLPDVVVMEDRANNFTDVDQRIEDCPIMYLDSGTRKPETMPIKGIGHVYVYESNPVQILVSWDGGTWTPILTESAGDVELDTANNFTHPEQQIQGSNILNLRKGSLAPDPATVVPLREGELYIQIAEGTADRKARMWISNNQAGWKWELLTHLYELPNTVVQTSKINNFESTGQTIAGKQIMSFIDGGDKNPQDAGAVPDYEGQFYIASKTNQMGYKDAAIWVAMGSQWLPIQENIDLNTIVRNDKSNRFSVPEQILGEAGANARWLIGAREKFSGHSPASDLHWRVQNIGEITIFTNNTVVPHETSIWIGLSKNPSGVTNAGEWGMVWSSSQGTAANYARVDQTNDFVPFQYINSGNKRHMINTGHEGGAGSPLNSLVPVAPGDTYTQSFSDPTYGTIRNIWIAAIEADTVSWKRVMCADDRDIVLTNQTNHFNDRDQFLGQESSTKRDRIMGARNHESSSTGIIGISPTAFGEVVVTKRWDPNHPSDATMMIVEAHIAVGTGRKSWIKIGDAVAKDLEIIDDGSNN
ncbi:MAG: hypothetical protein ACRC6V_08570 [Bacteroidales bacterium]